MEPDDMIREAVARLSEEVWHEGLDPEKEVARLQGMVSSGFWTRRNELMAEQYERDGDDIDTRLEEQ